MPVEAARGLLLLGVFHIHALYASLEHLGEVARQAQWQIKVLAPHVALYFALAGMTSRSLADKAWPAVVHRSLMLLLLALFSHALGVLILQALLKPWPSVPTLLAEVARPLVYGTGYATSVEWFFVVLAVVRLFAFAAARGWHRLLFALVAAAALVSAARFLGAPDNAYEWRNWPAALLLFWLGTRLAPNWRVPHALGLICAVAGLTLPLLNRPALLRDGPCLTCDIDFVAQPMLGGYGVMPLYLLQEGVATLGLLWLAQQVAPLRLGRFLAWVGRHSLQLLLLHGWVSVATYGLIWQVLPSAPGSWLFMAIFLVNTALHLLLYRLLRRPLDRVVALCAAASRRLVALARRPIITRS